MSAVFTGFKGRIFVVLIIIVLSVTLGISAVRAEAAEEENEEIRNPFELIYTPEEEPAEPEPQPVEVIEEDMTEQVYQLTAGLIEALEGEYTAEEIADRVLAAAEVNIEEDRFRELLAEHLSELEAEETDEIAAETDYVDPKLAAPEEAEEEERVEIDIEVDEPVPEMFITEKEDKLAELLAQREPEVREERAAPGERGREILQRFLPPETEEAEADEPEAEIDVEETEEAAEVDPETVLAQMAEEPISPEEAENLQEFISALVGAEVDLDRAPGEATAEVLERLDQIETREELDTLLDSIFADREQISSDLARQRIFRQEMLARPDWPQIYEFSFTAEEELTREELGEQYNIEPADIEIEEADGMYEYQLQLPAEMVYELQPGETAEDIARRSGIPLREILLASRREADELEAGDILLLPYDI